MSKKNVGYLVKKGKIVMISKAFEINTNDYYLMKEKDGSISIVKSKHDVWLEPRSEFKYVYVLSGITSTRIVNNDWGLYSLAIKYKEKFVTNRFGVHKEWVENFQTPLEYDADNWKTIIDTNQIGKVVSFELFRSKGNADKAIFIPKKDKENTPSESVVNYQQKMMKGEEVMQKMMQEALFEPLKNIMEKYIKENLNLKIMVNPIPFDNAISIKVDLKLGDEIFHSSESVINKSYLQ